MQEPRLFRLAVDAVSVSAFFEHRLGWSLTIRCRRGDESWADVQGETYQRLSTEELADVICSVISGELGLA